VGGSYYDLSDKALLSVDVGADIVNSMLDHSVIEMDVQQLPGDSDKEELTLMIRCETGDSKLEDTMRIYTSDIASAQKALEEDTEEEISEEEKEDQKIWILVAAGAVLVAGAVAAVVISRKKKAAKQEKPAGTAVPPEDLPDEDEPSFVFPEDLPDADDVFPPDDGEWKTAPPVEEGCRITLYALGYPDIVRALTIPKGRDMVVGRDGQADIVLDPKDTKLSRRHCCLSWDGSILCIKDLGSRNGTIYNGTVLAENVWMIVENDTRLKLGKFEYRVVMEENT
jgi:hypothetical protein